MSEVFNDYITGKITKQDYLSELSTRVSEETVWVENEDVAQVVSQWTKIPVNSITSTESENLRKLAEQEFPRKIVPSALLFLRVQAVSEKPSFQKLLQKTSISVKAQ